MDNFIKSFDATSQQANNKRYDHEFSYDHKMVKLVKNRLNDINSKNIEFIDLIKVTHQFEFKKYLEFDDDPLIIDGLR